MHKALLSIANCREEANLKRRLFRSFSWYFEHQNVKDIVKKSLFDEINGVSKDIGDILQGKLTFVSMIMPSTSTK